MMEQAGADTSHVAAIRFLAFCGEPLALRQWLLSLVPGMERPERLNRILNCADLVVYASPETPFIRLEGEDGLVLGELSGPDSCRRKADRRVMAEAFCGQSRSNLPGLDPAHCEAVAFLRGNGKIAVLAGHSSAVTTHFIEAKQVAAFTSHSELSSQLNAALSDGQKLEPGVLHWFSAGRLQNHPM